MLSIAKIPTPLEDLKIGLLCYQTSIRDLTASISSKIKSSENDFYVYEILENFQPASTSNWVLTKIVKPFGLDTMQLKKMLYRNIPYNAVHIYGLKDKYSVATQYLVIHRKHITSLEIILNKLDIPLKKICGVEDPYKIANQIKGNRFEIKVRDPPNENYTKQVIELIKRRGVINFYGYQRFGKYRLNHIVGKAILLGPRYVESLPSRIYNKLKMVVDLNIILNKHKLRKRRFRTMIKYFINSLQSYLFNKALSMRLITDNGIKVYPKDYCLEYVSDINRYIVIRCSDLNEDVRRIAKRLLAPIIGYDYLKMDTQDGFREIYLKLLEEEGLSINHFQSLVKEGIIIRGGFRKIIADISSISFSLVNKVLNIGFSLGRGSYATIVLRELIKPMLPSDQGF